MNEIRLAESQMRELKLCIMAGAALINGGNATAYSEDWSLAEAMLEYEPEPEPPDDGGNDYTMSMANQKILQLEAENRNLQKLVECLRASDERSLRDATYWREQVEGTTPGEDRAYDMLQTKIEELEKLVPKKRFQVKVYCTPITELYYAMDMVGLGHRMSPMFEDESVCLQWASDHGFEVVE
jgi:predicted RNase H-like nuclease (RuvC/YqgF family)